METLIITDKTEQELDKQEPKDLSRYIPLYEELPIVVEVNGAWEITRLSTKILVPPEYLKDGAYKKKNTYSYSQILSKEFEERGLTPPKNKPLEFRLCDKIEGVRDLLIGQLTDKEIDLVLEYYQNKKESQQTTEEYHKIKTKELGKIYIGSKSLNDEMTRPRERYKTLFDYVDEDEIRKEEEKEGKDKKKTKVITRNYGLTLSSLGIKVLIALGQKLAEQSSSYNTGPFGGLDFNELPKGLQTEDNRGGIFIAIDPYDFAKRVYGLGPNDTLQGNRCKAAMEMLKELDSTTFYSIEDESYYRIMTIETTIPRRGSIPGQMFIRLRGVFLSQNNQYIRRRSDELVLLGKLSDLAVRIYNYLSGLLSRDMPSMKKEGYIKVGADNLRDICRGYCTSYDPNPGRLEKNMETAYKELKKIGFLLKWRTEGTNILFFLAKDWLRKN